MNTDFPRTRSGNAEVRNDDSQRAVYQWRHRLGTCDARFGDRGGTTTAEPMVLCRPFLYFPLEGHFKQRLHVAGRLARLGAGVQLGYGKTTAGELAEAVLANIGREVSYPPIAADGADNAARLRCSLL